MTKLNENKREDIRPICYVCLEPGEHLKQFHTSIENGYLLEEKTLWYCAPSDGWSCDGWNHEFQSLLRDRARGCFSHEVCLHDTRGLIKAMSKRCSSARLAYFKRLLAEVGLMVETGA